jgi:hypothetical protein
MKKLLLLVLASLLLACSGPGADYLGTWVNSRSADNTIEIVRNGENFLVKETRPSLFGRNGETQTSNTPAVLKDGLLQIQSALGPVTITHVKDSDTLSMPGLLGSAKEYKRMK